MRIARHLLVSAGFVAALAGCASRPINEPIKHVDLTSGYRASIKIHKVPNNDSKTLFLIAFSGGGTRAAALSYGVLEELRRTEVVVDGHKRRLLDEVDLITGVSGGSFTALSYALYGDKLFSEYETRFLKRNVQGALLQRTLNPVQLAQAGRRQLRALRAGGRLLRRDPVPGRHLRRSGGQAHADGGRDRHRPVDRSAPRVRADRLRPALLRPEQGTPGTRRGDVLGRARGAVAGDLQQLRRHLRLRVSRRG